MPRGYLKNCQGVSLKLARGGGSRPSLKLVEKLLQEREQESRAKFKAESRRKYRANDDDDTDDDGDNTEILGPMSPRKIRMLNSQCTDCTADDGMCFLCGKSQSPLRRLTKKCRHPSACLSCLHSRFIGESQKSAELYPLCCFHPACRGRSLRLSHVQSIAKNDEELRMISLAIQRQKRHIISFCQNCEKPHFVPEGDVLAEQETCSSCKGRRNRRNPDSVASFVRYDLEILARQHPIFGIKQFHDDKMLVRRLGKLAQLQRTFKKSGMPWSVDVGYHYTSSENGGSIKRHGLLTPEERKCQGVVPHHENGQAYGPGIYLANNPVDYRGYGSLGLVVARLKGLEISQCSREAPKSRSTVVVPSGFCVLKNSEQCLILFEFNAYPPENMSSFDVFHQALVKRVETRFNKSKHWLSLAGNV